MASEPTAPRQAVFLVGGLGTRLGELTRTTPKPLVEVAGRPFLDWLVDEVLRQGVREVVLLSGYRAAQIETAMARLAAQGIKLVHSVEPEPLGTAGALVHAREHLAETFVLLNGDSLFRIDLADLAVPDDPTVLARLSLRQEADAGRYGSVALDGERVTGFAEKQPSATPTPGLINGGVYWMRRQAIEALPPGPCSLERDVLPALVAAGRVQGRVYDAPFIDIGVPESLALAQTYVPAALSKI
jgi:D-glycero-D-manno-heptose 1,7-bisphosphate phosphatase